MSKQESKFKIIKHSIGTDGNVIVHKANRNGVFKGERDEIEQETGDGSVEETAAANSTSNSLKPFIDKIMATPLHFMRFNTNLGTTDNKDEGKYIVIGDKTNEAAVIATSHINIEDTKQEKEVYRPKSLAESLLNYITPKASQKRKRDDSTVRCDNEEEEKEDMKKFKASPLPEENNLKSDLDEKSSDSDGKTPINSDNELLPAHTIDDEEDIGEQLEENGLKELDEQLKENAGVANDHDGGVNANHEAENSDSNVEATSPDGKTAVSTPETNFVAPETNQNSLLKQQLEPPVNIDLCSPITLNLSTDHGSKFEPFPMTKNWMCAKNSNKKFYPKGLINHGVTCYINSAIQAMLHIPAMQNYLMDLLQNPAKYPMIAKNSVTWQLAETSKKMWFLNSDGGSNYYDPKRLISRLGDINCMMSEWEQEDSHEYFMSLLSRLQEDSVPKGVPMIQSIIYQIFGGKFKQSIRCGSCHQTSVTEQMFYDLSVFLSKKKKTSNINLNNCVEQFFQKEKINDGYNCDNCKATNKNSEKQIAILEEPEYLVIHLKKYKFDGLESHKMKQKVNFNKYLDLTPFKDNSETPSIYQLISVVCHSGRSLSSGHYIAHTLQPDQTWATYDDDYINKISETDVLDVNDAYYLVYSKLTPKKDLREIKGLKCSPSQPSTPVSKKNKHTSSAPFSSSPDRNHNAVLAARLKLFGKNKQKHKKFNKKKFRH